MNAIHACGKGFPGGKVSVVPILALASHHNLLAGPCLALLPFVQCSDPPDMNGCGAHLISPLLVTLFSFPFKFPGVCRTARYCIDVGHSPVLFLVLLLLYFALEEENWHGEASGTNFFAAPLFPTLALLPWNHTSQLPRTQKECFNLRKRASPFIPTTHMHKKAESGGVQYN